MDRRYIVDVQLQQCPFRLAIDLTIGSDYDGLAAGWLEMGGLFFVTHVLSLKEKAAVATYAVQRVADMEAQGRNPILWLRGQEALWSETHPNRGVFEAAFKPVADFVRIWGDARSDGTSQSGPRLFGGRRVSVTSRGDLGAN